MGIYVETRIRGDLDEIWRKTQDPRLHERWDARFTAIVYLPRLGESDPQRSRYTTRIGFGLAVAGEGESVADRRDAGGTRTSSLRFRSDDPKSLIREGAGYWRYVPTPDGVRFVTAYDYRTRFGRPGRLFDRLAFRPLMGWATAWSFDRLRLWVERGVDPEDALRRSVTHALCRGAVASVWAYQGLVPKLIARHPDEAAMLADAGVAEAAVPAAVALVGVAEVLLGAAVLVWFRRRWPLRLTVLLMAVATAGVAAGSPRYLAAAFNPVSLNLLLAVVALVGLIAMKDLPSARRCLRRRPEGER